MNEYHEWKRDDGQPVVRPAIYNRITTIGMSFGAPARLLSDYELEVMRKPRVALYCRNHEVLGCDVWVCRSKFATGFGFSDDPREGMRNAWDNWKAVAKRRDDDARRTVKRGQAPDV